MKKSAAMAVPLVAGMIALPWVLYVREVRREVAVPPPAPSEAVLPEAPAPPARPASAGPGDDARRQGRERLANDPVDLVGLALELAAEEEARIRAYETSLTRMADQLALAESYRIAGRWTELADLAEAAIRGRPVIKLVLLDPAWLQKRAIRLICRLSILLREAQLALLDSTPPTSPQEEDTRTQLRLKWANESREYARQIEELELRPMPSRSPRSPDPPNTWDPGALSIEQESATRRIDTMRMTCDFTSARFEEVVDYLRKATGLNIVVRGAETAGSVTIQLRDVMLGGLLDQVSSAAGLSWKVDRFGIVTLAPAAK